MKIPELFKIRHRVTKKYSKGGAYIDPTGEGWSWGFGGKIWQGIGPLRLHLKQYKKDRLKDWDVIKIMQTESDGDTYLGPIVVSADILQDTGVSWDDAVKLTGGKNVQTPQTQKITSGSLMAMWPMEVNEIHSPTETFKISCSSAIVEEPLIYHNHDMAIDKFNLKVVAMLNAGWEQMGSPFIIKYDVVSASKLCAHFIKR